MIVLSIISKSAFQHAQGNTSRELWLALERAFAPHTSSREYTLKTQLLKIQMKIYDLSSVYLTRAQEYSDAIANIGEPMKENDLVMLVLSGLREEYNGLKSTIYARQVPIPLVDLHALLLDHDYMFLKTSTEVTPAQAFNVFSCNLKHTTRINLRTTVIRLTTIDQATPATTMDVVRYTTLPSQCPNRDPNTLRSRQEPSANYTDYRSQASSTWLPDTVSSHHVASNLSSFDKSEAYYGEDNLHVGNGKGLPILHIGSSRFHSSTKTFNLKHILHVPAITQNLLFVQQFCQDNNVYFEFHTTFFLVKDTSTHNILHTGPSNGGLYSFNLLRVQSRVSFSTTRASPTTWHQRLGHPYPQLLKAMFSKFCLPLTNNCSSISCDSSSIGNTSYHGYCCLDPQTDCIYVACHVRFNEQLFPFAFSPPPLDPSPFNEPYYTSYPTAPPVPTLLNLQNDTPPQTEPPQTSPTMQSSTLSQPSPFSSQTYSRRTDIHTTTPSTSSAYDRYIHAHPYHHPPTHHLTLVPLTYEKIPNLIPDLMPTPFTPISFLLILKHNPLLLLTNILNGVKPWLTSTQPS
uniref:GAG-pre-integrase domain-containing protein n=1 Tax=Lactuca sativa TaxID=4236 RepID=A0A9R1XK10_LACSA|nr:hypothetical protein LSAT_V11C400220110 [Lactuca sativa]